MPLPKAPRGKLLFAQSILVTGMLVGILVYGQLSLPAGNVGQLTNPDTLVSSPLLGHNFTEVASGKITGLHNADGTLTYDIGVLVSNNSTGDGSAGYSMGIPLYVDAWMSYNTSSHLTAKAGRIMYESINLSYMSSYQFYETGFHFNGLNADHSNSYASSASGHEMTGTSGSVTEKKSVRTFNGTPNPEEDYIVNRTYSETLPYLSYSFGAVLPGSWILSNGSQNTNTLALSITEKMGIITSVSNGLSGKTLNVSRIIIETLLLVKYDPGIQGLHNPKIAGTYYILHSGTGIYSNLTSVAYSTLTKSYF